MIAGAFTPFASMVNVEAVVRLRELECGEGERRRGAGELVEVPVMIEAASEL